MWLGGSAGGANRGGRGGGRGPRGAPEPQLSGYATAIMSAQLPLCRRLIGSGGCDLGGYYDTPPGEMCDV